MASADERYVIVYNGEIYNFRALRTELAARGAVFKTESDTEVLLQSGVWRKPCDAPLGCSHSGCGTESPAN